MENEIINRVSKSPLVTFDLEELYHPGERVLFDIRSHLYQELVLKEKDFRDFIKTHDWQQYQNKLLAVTCTVDAIVPTWAYMLLATALRPYASRVIYGTLEELETILYFEALQKVEWEKFERAKVVIKGCSKVEVPASAYIEATNRLLPFASSIMFGEPCSTVPIFKKK